LTIAATVICAPVCEKVAAGLGKRDVSLVAIEQFDADSALELR